MPMVIEITNSGNRHRSISRFTDRQVWQQAAIPPASEQLSKPQKAA
jgi:hypothetical protein